MKTSKEKINQFLDHYNDKQNEFLLELLEIFSSKCINKGKIMSVVYNEEEKRKVDSALPMGHVQAIQEWMPNFNTFSYAVDYNDKSFGEIVNLQEKLFNKMQTKLQI